MKVGSLLSVALLSLGATCALGAPSAIANQKRGFGDLVDGILDNVGVNDLIEETGLLAELKEKLGAKIDEFAEAYGIKEFDLDFVLSFLQEAIKEFGNLSSENFEEILDSIFENVQVEAIVEAIKEFSGIADSKFIETVSDKLKEISARGLTLPANLDSLEDILALIEANKDDLEKILESFDKEAIYESVSNFFENTVTKDEIFNIISDLGYDIPVDSALVKAIEDAIAGKDVDGLEVLKDLIKDTNVEGLVEFVESLLKDLPSNNFSEEDLAALLESLKGLREDCFDSEYMLIPTNTEEIKLLLQQIISNGVPTLDELKDSFQKDMCIQGSTETLIKLLNDQGINVSEEDVSKVFDAIKKAEEALGVHVNVENLALSAQSLTIDELLDDLSDLVNAEAIIDYVVKVLKDMGLEIDDEHVQYLKDFLSSVEDYEYGSISLNFENVLTVAEEKLIEYNDLTTEEEKKEFLEDFMEDITVAFTADVVLMIIDNFLDTENKEIITSSELIDFLNALVDSGVLPKDAGDFVEAVVDRLEDSDEELTKEQISQVLSETRVEQNLANTASLSSFKTAGIIVASSALLYSCY